MRNDRRDVVVTEVQSRILAACIRQTSHPDGLPLDVLINDTLYHEQKRMETDVRSPRRGSDQVFWGEIKVRLRKAGEVELRSLLTRIIRRFATEILGNFNAAVYQMTTKVLPTTKTVKSASRDADITDQKECGVMTEMIAGSTITVIKIAPTAL